MQKHTWFEKLYKCDGCDKEFYALFNLTRHIRSHSLERLYKCDICNKGYTKASNLTTHIIRSHTDKKAF